MGMALSLKEGVSLVGINPALVIGAIVVADVYAELDADCVITSAVDGQHSETSLHYAGQAFDFRTRTLTPEQQQDLIVVLKERLTQDFDVVLESDHIHLELQPRRAPTEPLTA
jgi:hypothetical protein